MSIEPEALMANVEAALLKAGYSERTINENYHYGFNWLVQFMKKRGIPQYTPEVGAEALPLMQEKKSTFAGKRDCEYLIRHVDNFVAQAPIASARKRNGEIGKYYPELSEYLEWYAKRVAVGTFRNHRYYVRCIEEGFYDLGLCSIKDLKMRAVVDFCEALPKFSPSAQRNIAASLVNVLRYLYEHSYIERVSRRVYSVFAMIANPRYHLIIRKMK